jgi:hypothetical protein
MQNIFVLNQLYGCALALPARRLMPNAFWSEFRESLTNMPDKYNFMVCRERRRLAGTPPKAACLAKTIANIGDAEHFCT